MIEYPFGIDFINIENYNYAKIFHVIFILLDCHHIMIS
jgi:hypothetical protein